MKFALNSSPVICGDLPSLENGQITLTTMAVEPIANYSCDSSYSPVSNTTIICQAISGVGLNLLHVEFVVHD